MTLNVCFRVASHRKQISGLRESQWISGCLRASLVSGAVAASSPLRLGLIGSFSLRTLLIATTLIAVVLGLVVWSIR